MTPAEYRTALSALGITQARLGRLCKVNKDTPTNWGKGRTEIPRSVALLLRAVEAGLVTFEQLEALP